MLPRQHRLTRPDDFRRTIRGGSKAAAPTVLAYGLLPDPSRSSGPATGDCPARVGVTVNKAVGGSVVRHRVARQIRHVMATELPRLPDGSTWVIRALPWAGTPAGSAALAHQLRDAVERILGSRR